MLLDKALCLTLGAFHSTKNAEIFETKTNSMKISWERFRKIRNLLYFKKKTTIRLNRNFGKFQDEGQMERKFQKFGYTSEIGNYVYSQFSIQPCSFGYDHGELNILRKDFGDVYSRKIDFK